MDIRVSTTDGFTDIFLPIKSTKTESGVLSILAEGAYNGVTTGIRIEVPEKMEMGLKEEGDQWKVINTYREKTYFKSLGESSDAFLKMIADFYECKTTGKFRSEVNFTLLPMTFKEFDIQQEYLKSKLFFEEPEDLYCELFLNFDLPKGYVEFSEKDIEYRVNLVKTFQV
jgi:hypothetical protein